MTRTLRAAAAATLALLLFALAAPAAGADADGWYVVSFEGRITQADRDELVASGAEALQYTPEDSYLAWLEGDGRRRVRRGRRVRDARPLRPEEKIDVGGSGELLVGVVVRGSRLAGALDALAGLGTVRRSGLAQPDGSLREVVLSAPASALGAIAALPEVLYVGPSSPGLQPDDEASAQIMAGNLSPSKQPVVGYNAWLAARGLDGTGVRVSIVDTGVDELHPDLSGRVVARVDYNELTGEPRDVGGHGTHVAGIVGGAGSALAAAGGVRDSAGFLYGLGMAPKVELVNQNAISTTAGRLHSWPPEYGWDRLSRDAVRNGAIAWNASWNSLEGTNAGYIESARTLDVMSRDADWLTAGAEPLILVFSAGNGSSGSNPTSTITAPKEAKNIITVANSYGHRAGPIDTISGSSSRGPAKDGRILPTITAPGSSIMSTRALPAAQSCNTPATDSFGLYALCSGTSMAAPHVTGAVALIAQWWKPTHGGKVPSPAMAKALLMHTATDIGTADIPNKNEGWGRVNLGTLFDPTATRIYDDQGMILTEPGEGVRMTLEAVDPSKPLKVTVVWSDAPGAAGAMPALVNDLDLTLTATDGTVYHGNRFSGGRSVAGGGPDRKNNLENIFVSNPAGTYAMDLTAVNLPGDGVPFTGDDTDQDYALVISNARVVS